MGAASRPDDQSGRPEADGWDPWVPPEQRDPLRKRREGAADQPTVTSMPAGDPTGAPHGSPVGPPPPAPEGPSAGSPYPPGETGYGGYGYGGYGRGGGYGYGGHGHGGYPQPGSVWPSAPLPQGTAVASMVLGIVGLVLTLTFWGAFLGIFVAPVALALGVSGRRKADRGEAGGRNFATSGFVMGIVGTAFAALVVVLVILFLAHVENFDSGPSSDSDYYDALRTPTAVALTGR